MPLIFKRRNDGGKVTVKQINQPEIVNRGQNHRHEVWRVVRRKKLESQKQVIDSLKHRENVSRGWVSSKGKVDMLLKKSPARQTRIKNLWRSLNRNGGQTQEWPRWSWCWSRKQWKEWLSSSAWNLSELDQDPSSLVESTLCKRSRINKDKCILNLIRGRLQSLRDKDAAFQTVRKERHITCEGIALTDSRLVIITNRYQEILSKCWGETTTAHSLCNAKLFKCRGL